MHASSGAAFAVAVPAEDEAPIMASVVAMPEDASPGAATSGALPSNGAADDIATHGKARKRAGSRSRVDAGAGRGAGRAPPRRDRGRLPGAVAHAPLVVAGATAQ